MTWQHVLISLILMVEPVGCGALLTGSPPLNNEGKTWKELHPDGWYHIDHPAAGIEPYAYDIRCFNEVDADGNVKPRTEPKPALCYRYSDGSLHAEAPSNAPRVPVR